MRTFVLASALAVSHLVVQASPAPYFSVDFSAMGSLPSYLESRPLDNATYGALSGGQWVFTLPNSRTFDAWAGVDDCALLSFETGTTNIFAVQTHLTGYTFGGNTAAGIIVYLTTFSGDNNLYLFGPYQGNGLNVEGSAPGVGGHGVLGGVINNVHLRIEVIASLYCFFYSFDGETWILARTLNAGNETSVRIGLFSKSWEHANTGSSFANFIYEPLDVSILPPTQDGIWVGPSDGVTPGLWTDAGNWSTGVVPGDGNKGGFEGWGKDFYVTFPEGGLTESSWTSVQWTGSDPGDGPLRVTFDTRGTSWMNGAAFFGRNGWSFYAGAEGTSTSGSNAPHRGRAS